MARKNDRKGVTYDQFGPYKYPFACFYCRKVFKTAFGVQLRDIEDYLAKCPQCGGKMCYTGRAFKAPRQEDTQQWQILEVLITSGFRFEPFGYDTGDFPRTLREVPAYLEEWKNQLLGKT